MENFKKVIEKYNGIGNINDLRKNKLTLAEHRLLGYVLKDLSQGFKVKCYAEKVAEWCERAGLKVIPPHDTEINYIISLS